MSAGGRPPPKGRGRCGACVTHGPHGIYGSYRTYKTYRTYIEEQDPETAANTLLCLIHQTNYLLDQQLRQMEAQFLEEGGFTERLYRKRQEARRTR